MRIDVSRHFFNKHVIQTWNMLAASIDSSWLVGHHSGCGLHFVACIHDLFHLVHSSVLAHDMRTGGFCALVSFLLGSGGMRYDLCWKHVMAQFMLSRFYGKCCPLNHVMLWFLVLLSSKTKDRVTMTVLQPFQDLSSRMSCPLECSWKNAWKHCAWLDGPCPCPCRNCNAAAFKWCNKSCSMKPNENIKLQSMSINQTNHGMLKNDK